MPDMRFSVARHRQQSCCTIAHTEAVEDHLETVFHHCTRDGVATTSGLAAQLGLAAPTVSAVLRRLEALELAAPHAGLPARARELAAALAQLDGVDVVPAVPQTPLFHVHLHVPRAALDQAHPAHVDEGGLNLYLYSRSTSSPAWSRFELTVWEQAKEIDVTDVLTAVVTRAAPRPLAHHLGKSRNRHDPQRQAPYRLEAALAKGSQR